MARANPAGICVFSINVYVYVWFLVLSRTVSTASDCVKTVVVCEEFYGVLWTSIGVPNPEQVVRHVPGPCPTSIC